MSQVSESSASASDALGSLQTRGANPVRRQPKENSGSDRVATQERAKDARRAASAEDKVQISREAKDQGDTQNPSGKSGNSVEAKKSNQVQPPDAEKNSKIIEQQASDRKNSEVQLRDFQNKNVVKIEPQIVAESVDEIEYQREKAEAAKEPALEPPSQRIIQKGGSTGSESERSAAVNGRNDAQGSRKEPPNAVSAQTQTGQNVDSLI